GVQEVTGSPVTAGPHTAFVQLDVGVDADSLEHCCREFSPITGTGCATKDNGQFTRSVTGFGQQFDGALRIVVVRVVVARRHERIAGASTCTCGRTVAVLEYIDEH